MNANDIIDEAFDKFASQFDHESNEWLDMDVQRIFASGWKAALKSSLPAEAVSEAMVVNGQKDAMNTARNLALLCSRLCRRVSKFNPNDDIVKISGEYLNETGLLSVFRDGDAAAIAPADDGWRPIARDALRELAFAPVPDTIPDLVCDALRYADRVSVLLNDLSREVLALTVDDNDHRFDKLHDLLRRRFFDCSGMHLFIAADKLNLALPSDLRGDDDTLPAPPKDGRE